MRLPLTMTSILDSNFIFCCYFLLLFELLLELKLRVKRFDRNEIYFAESGENSKWKSFLYPMIWNRPVVGMLTVLFCLVSLSLSLSLFFMLSAEWMESWNETETLVGKHFCHPDEPNREIELVLVFVGRMQFGTGRFNRVEHVSQPTSFSSY